MVEEGREILDDSVKISIEMEGTQGIIVSEIPTKFFEGMYHSLLTRLLSLFIILFKI